MIGGISPRVRSHNGGWLIALALVVTLILTLLVSACQPKAGDKCNAGQARCVDGKSALVCANGAYVAASCGGPHGCSGEGGQVQCDNSIASVGDGCDEPADIACGSDKLAELTCTDNKFTVKTTCKGPKGCTFSGNTLYCDNDYSDVNDVCDDNGDYACTMDHHGALRCKDNKFALESSCKGPKGCNIVNEGDGGVVRCDDDLANLNDLCHAEGDFACSTDSTMLLRCTSSKFTELNACRGKRGCTMKEHPTRKVMDFDCDDAIALAGDPCDTPGEVACLPDGSASLVCRGTTFALGKTCATHSCSLLSEMSIACK